MNNYRFEIKLKPIKSQGPYQIKEYSVRQESLEHAIIELINRLGIGYNIFYMKEL